MKITIAQIKSFCLKYGLSDSAFGRKAINDPHLINHMENKNRALKPVTVLLVKRFMRTYPAIHKAELKRKIQCQLKRLKTGS